jgi:TonB-linked SusC/RagA family outer membrane protein
LYALSLTIALSLYNNTQARTDEGDQDAISTVIKLVKKKFSLIELFSIVETQAGVRFAYDATELDINVPVEISAKKLRLNQLLSEVTKQSGASFEWSKNTVTVIPPRKHAAPPAPKSADMQTGVRGKVVDKSGQPVAGAAVVVKGTSIGATTDEKGNFNINAKQGDVLEISYVGYRTVEVTVVNTTDISVVLDELRAVLNDVVVVGYGTQKKTNLTGAVGVVKMEDMVTRPLTNTSQALQGTVSGVYALQSSGKPGDDGTVIDVRGVGTFGNNSPLVLIDGVPGNINDVTANDIASVSVLKDAASAAIYGNRAANGVILITTKKGTAGKLSVNYSAYIGTQKPTRLPHVLNSVDYTTLYNEASLNSGGGIIYADSTIQKYRAHNNPMYPDIDYFHVYYGDATIQNHRLSLTGGSDNVTFALMLGHLDQDGILVGTNYKKTDFRSNIDAYFLNKKLRISGKLAGNYGVKNEPTDLWSAEWYATLAPIHPLQNAAGQWVSVNGERNFYGEIKEGSTAQTKRYNFSGQVEGEYKILNGLSAQVTYGYNVTPSKVNAFHANVTLYNESGTTTNLASNLTVTNETDVQTLLTTLLKYNKTIGKHEFNVLGGYSEEEFTYDWESGYRANFVNNTQRVLNLGDASTQTNNAGSYDLGLRSYFGRLNYAFDNKYLFEANIRRDGSSRFAKGHQWGTFPSFSAGWIISKEKFMESLSWLNHLKLRASWGRLGNQNISNYYNGSDILSSGQNYSLGGTLYSGVAVTAMTNKDLTWETAEQLDFGADLVFENNFEVTADYFDKRTKNLLLTQPIPLTMAESAPYANAGEVQNKGIEAMVTYKTELSNGLKLRASVNASHIVNKITKMNVAEQLVSPKAIKVGAAINSFYGYKMDGIYQISDFTWQNNSDPSIPYANRTYTLKPGVVQVANFNAQPGDIKYKDMGKDNIVDMNNDRAIIGSQFPDLTYALTFNAEWKGFDLGVFMQGVKGIQGYTYYEIASPFSGFANMGNWWLGRWTPDNPSNSLPRLTLDGVRNGIHSSFYMENAAYLRMKNIELGYSINPHILSKAGIRSLRVYGNIQNAFTITKFKGFDPEQTVDQTRAQAFPQVRIMTMGVNVNF